MTEVPGYEVTCVRCGYSWTPYKHLAPSRCANPACRSPYWNTPRKLKGVRKATQYVKPTDEDEGDL